MGVVKDKQINDRLADGRFKKKKRRERLWRIRSFFIRTGIKELSIIGRERDYLEKKLSLSEFSLGEFSSRR